MKPIALAYLGSHFLSLLGNGIVAVALPLVVLQVTGSPLSVGAISAATAIPAVAIGLIAGVVLDRWNRRDISVISDVVSAGAVAALPIVDVLWGLELWWFIALGILGSFGDVPGSTAREVLVPSIAQRTGIPLERLVGLRQTLTSAALIIGPALAGTLVAFLGSSAVFYVTAGTSAAAALLTLVIPRDAGRVPRDTNVSETPWQQIVGGFVVLRHSRFLIAVVVLMIGLATVFGGLQGLVLPLHFGLIAQPHMLGFVLTFMAVGLLIGASLFTIVGPRLSRGFWLGVGLSSLTVSLIGLATLASVPLIFGAALCVGLSNAVLGSVLGVLLVEKTPDRARGRVFALQNTALQLAAPIGIGGAALIAEVSSPTIAGFAVCAAWIIAVVIVLATRSLRGTDEDGGSRVAK